MPSKTPIRANEKSSSTVRKPQPAARALRHQAEQVNAAGALARAMAAPARRLTPADILALQRAAGNRAVGQILAERMQHEQQSHQQQSHQQQRRQQQGRLTVQAKLVVGAADDPYEREADRVAASIVQTSEPSVPNIQLQPSREEDEEEILQAKPLASSITPLIQRQEMPEKDEEETLVQRRGDGGTASVEPSVEHAIARARTGGRPLPGNLRKRMEQAFGADFSGVRVHADSESDGLNRSLEARAFTTGRDLFFKRGEYNPDSLKGQEVIAHELTHVVQQNGGATRKHGLSVQRAPSNVIQRSVADGLRVDRHYWKMLPTNLKLAAIVAAPVLGPLGEAWESGKGWASYIYTRLAGDNPSIIRAVLSGLVATPGALAGGLYGLAKGFLKGLSFGIGNPLYSVGKRVIEGAKAIPETYREARGFYGADPTHPKYGNISEQERRENYNIITKTDMANYLLLATGGVSSLTAALTKRALFIGEEGIKGLISDADVPMLSETGKALSIMGAVSGGVGAATSLMDARKGYKEWKDTAGSKAQQRLGMGVALSGIASAAQQSATAAYHIANLTQSGAAATAQVVSGGAGVATGAVDILRGLYGRSKATQNIARLESLKQRESLQGAEGRDIKKAAGQAASTQEMRKSVATGTIAKGALTVAGGALLAVSAATPIGWTLLGIGAVIGGIYALRRWLDKRERKEEIAMRELKVTKTERMYWEKDVENIKKRTWWGSNERKHELKRLGPDPLERKLDQFGFKGVSHFYANYINYMANYLYEKGVTGRMDIERQVSQVIEARKALGYRVRNIELDRGLDGLSYKQIERRVDNEGIGLNLVGNHYPEVEEVIEGMGLKFNWRQLPFQPEPAKIGKALDE